MTSYDLQAESQALAPQLVADRRHLHRHPELAGHEQETSRYIAGRLSALGLSPKLLLEETAATVDITGDGPAGPVLLLRADTDALPIQERGEERPYRSEVPGVMHACGHDGHIAIALAAAELLSSHRDQFGGMARIVFQPAEETAGGAERMISAGVMDSPAASTSGAASRWAGSE